MIGLQLGCEYEVRREGVGESDLLPLAVLPSDKLPSRHLHLGDIPLLQLGGLLRDREDQLPAAVLHRHRL